MSMKLSLRRTASLVVFKKLCCPSNKHGKTDSIDYRRIVYEMPFFLLFSYALHAGARGLHDAFIYIIRNNSLSSFFIEIRKIAKLYLEVYSHTYSFIQAINSVTDIIKRDSLRDSFRYYVFTYLTSGEPVKALEYIVHRSMSELENDIYSRYRLSTIVVEAVVIIPVVSIVLMFFQAELVILTYVLLLVLLALSFYMSSPLLTYLVIRLERIDIAAGIAYYVFSFLALLFLLSDLIGSDYEVLIGYVFLSMATVTGFIIFRRLRTLWKRFYSKINSLKYLLRVAELDTSSVSSITEVVRRTNNIDKELKEIVIIGRPLSKTSGGSAPLSNILSQVITAILLNAMRSGSNVVRVTLTLTEFLDKLGSIVKDIIFKSLYYSLIVVIAFALYSYSFVYLSHTLSSDDYLNLHEFLGPIAPGAGLDILGNTKLLIMSAALSFMLTIIIISKIIRGSVFVALEVGLIPWIVAAVSIASFLL